MSEHVFIAESSGSVAANESLATAKALFKRRLEEAWRIA